MRIYEALKDVWEGMDYKTRGLVVGFLLLGKEIGKKNLTDEELIEPRKEYNASEVSKMRSFFRRFWNMGCYYGQG